MKFDAKTGKNIENPEGKQILPANQQRQNQQQEAAITRQIVRQQAEADNPDAWWLPSQPSIMTFYKNFRERGI